MLTSINTGMLHCAGDRPASEVIRGLTLRLVAVIGPVGFSSSMAMEARENRDRLPQLTVELQSPLVGVGAVALEELPRDGGR